MNTNEYLSFSLAESLYFSPGVKVGCMPGEKGGLVAGVKISVVNRPKGSHHGAVFGPDAINNVTGCHIRA